MSTSPPPQVKHRWEEQIEEALKKVSSPKSSAYGSYWSLDETCLELVFFGLDGFFGRVFGLRKELSLKQVQAWAETEGSKEASWM